MRHPTLLATLAVAMCAACASFPPGPRAPLQPGDLLVLDSDSGAEVLDGTERLGQLFVARAHPEGGYAPLQLVAEDPRWVEPLEVLPLPDGSLIVLERQWSPSGVSLENVDEDLPAGALFHVRPGSREPPRLLTAPSVWRFPVSLALGPAGELYVADRAADPLGLGEPTGAIWVFDDPLAGGDPRVAAAGPQLVTPGPMSVDGDGRLLIMDADANPLGLELPGGRKNTPGVLYRLEAEELVTLVVPRRTISPIGMARGDDGRLFVIDANFGWGPAIRGDGAVFELVGEELELRVDSVILGTPGALRDPVDADTLPDGRLVVVDGNLDPLGLGEDGTVKGVHGTGPGALVWVDPDAQRLGLLIADPRFVSPMCVRRVR